MNAYKYYIYSPGLSYGSKPDFLRGDQLDARGGFSSLYAVTAETAEAIQQTGTTSQFKGVVWSQRLWLDVDGYEKADAVEQRIKEMGYGYIGFDSGGRGAHFGILREALPSHVLPQQDKEWAKKHFPECDPSIYTHLHLFRLPGTVHQRTRRQKLLVVEQDGKSLKHGPFKAWGDAAKAEVKPSFKSAGPDSIFSCFEVMVNSLPVASGSRHASLVRLVYALKDSAQVAEDLAAWWVSEVNKSFQEPKSEQEVTKIIRDVYRRAG